MNPQQASAFFAAHKVEILGGGAAVVALLGYRQRKKSSSTTAGATIPGTIPAAAVVGGTGTSAATYDSTAFDTYDALQQQISDLASRQQTSSPTTASGATPAPIASTLFAPAGSGNYLRNSYGNLVEVESDGSLYGLTGSQLRDLQSSGGLTGATITDVGDWTNTPGFYTQQGNLQAVNGGSAPQTYTATAANKPGTWTLKSNKGALRTAT